MRRALLITLLSACLRIPTIRAISLEKCRYRITDMQHSEESFKLAIFDCDFDEDLYMKSRLDGDLAPIISTASKEDVTASIAESAIVSAIPWANFAGLTIAHESAVPNSLFSYSHNVKLECQHEAISFELFQKPSHQPPIDFLYSLPPMKNSINELWQAFGAYKWLESPIPRRMSVALMVDAGVIAQEDLDACIDHGKLIMSTDTKPLEACPSCSFVPKGFSDGCSREECSIWHYSDSLGNPVNPLPSVPVQYADNQCSLDIFTNFTNERLPQLYELLETSKTRKESDAAMLSYATIINNMDYAACRDMFDSLYTTKSATIFLKGVRGCVDPTNELDPCCNEAAQWSDCCLPEDKYIEIEGVFNSTNPDAINAMCGANSIGVKNLIDAEISQVLMATSHPELGCSAKYEKVVPKNGASIYETLWDESSVSKCEEEVRWGKTMTESETCTNNDECWSGSCVSNGSQKRCTQLYGEAIAGPLLSCVVSRVDKKVWKYMAHVIDIDPSKVKKGAVSKGAGWTGAVEKFKKIIGRPNCVGEKAESGICAIIDVTKEECLSINHLWDRSRQMEWIIDETNINGGFCKKRESSWWDGNHLHIHIHGHTENVQEECEAIIDAMQGACTDSAMPNGHNLLKSESECTGNTEAWFSFASRAVGGHRLVSQKIYMLEEASGNWIESVRKGEKDKCMLETTCNWDPDGRITSGDSQKCLDPSPLATTTYPRATFEEDGKHMTCLQCWGSRCEDFSSANPPICAVAPHNHDGCADDSGGGPNNDSPISAMTALEGEDSHMKCRRNDLESESECLPDNFCPIPLSESNLSDEWSWHCAESSCWDLSKNEESCHYDETTEIFFDWRSEYRGGNGACHVDYDHKEGKNFEGKSYCESKDFLWWEGRAFKSGKFNSAEECTSYCNDGTWPPQKTCDSGSCNEHCAQCVEGNSWQFPDGVACYLISEIDQNECFSLIDYEWDSSTKLCFRKQFSGTEAECIAFDQYGGDDFSLSLSMSMSMIFDLYDLNSQKLSLTHAYTSCLAQAEDTCAAYCWAKDYDDSSSCQNKGLEWDWSFSHCKHPTWMVNQDSSPTCESYAAGLDENSSERDRWQGAKQCWSNGCHFDWSVGLSAPMCTGKAKGCAQQEGNNEWVDGGDDSTATAKVLLGCRWDMWRSCTTEETCVNAGECEDWFIGNDGGRCIVPLEPNEWGHRKGCHEVKHPIDGTQYEWAERMGCVARKAVDGVSTNVNEAECSSVEGIWHVRANSKEKCEDDRGYVCTHPFDEWRVFGGIESEEKCDTCGYETTPHTKWRPGTWSTSAETPLYWVERAFSTKNKWEENSFDPSAFHAFVRNSISRYIADAYKGKVYCELSAYNAFIPAIISMCSADGDGSNGEQNILKYDLTTTKVSCGDLQDQPPMETYEGSISYANAECTNKEDKFAETTMGKVVPLNRELGSGRRTTSSSVCSQHEIIKNSNNAIIGQKLGSGLSVTNVENATVCIKPTVPESDTCSNHVEFGICTVDSQGSYSVPLSMSTTINQQGEICFDGGESGVTYVPVKLMSGWEAVNDIATQAPTTMVVVTESPSYTPTEFPSSTPSNSPTDNTGDDDVHDHGAPSASPSDSPTNFPTGSSKPSSSPSKSLMPTRFPSSLPSLTPYGLPSLHPSSTELPSISPSKAPTKNPTSSPTKNGVGSVEVSFEVAVKLDGMNNVSDLNASTLDSIVNLLEKVFLSMVPQGARIRLLKIGGFTVTRRLIRYLQEDDSGGIDVEFEVIITKKCNTVACDDSDEISSAVYDEVTSDLEANVEDGEMSHVIQEKAESEGVSELSNATVSSNSFKVTAAKVTIEKKVQKTEAPTIDDSASTMERHGVMMSVIMTLPLLISFFGMH